MGRKIWSVFSGKIPRVWNGFVLLENLNFTFCLKDYIEQTFFRAYINWYGLGVFFIHNSEAECLEAITTQIMLNSSYRNASQRGEPRDGVIF